MGWDKLDQAQLRATLTGVKDGQGKTPVIERPDWTISLELYAGRYFGHVIIHKPWTPQRARHLEHDFQSVIDALGEPVFILHTPGDTKHLKFIKKYRFQYVSTHPRLDGQGYLDVFVRL